MQSGESLAPLIVDVAKSNFGQQPFKRRELMEAVESRIRQSGDWTTEDDDLSGSVGIKSKGLARIDWAISVTENKGLIHLGHNEWKVDWDYAE